MTDDLKSSPLDDSSPPDSDPSGPAAKTLMIDDPKVRFDALVTLRDHAWKEFQDKSAAEWRLSFGIWAALLGAAAAVIAAKEFRPAGGWQAILPAILFVLLGLHGWFLYWIQTKLAAARTLMRVAHEEMWGLAVREQQIAERDPWYEQPTMWVQLFITFLLAAVLYAVVYSLANTPLRPTKGGCEEARSARVEILGDRSLRVESQTSRAALSPSSKIKPSAPSTEPVTPRKAGP